MRRLVTAFLIDPVGKRLADGLVLDRFYVTDQEGRKIVDEQRLQEITAALLEAIDSMGRE